MGHAPAAENPRPQTAPAAGQPLGSRLYKGNTPMKLATYADWRRCIEVQCGIPLTAPYIAERIRALSDQTSDQTRKFVEVWGDAHRQRVLAWFRQANAEI